MFIRGAKATFIEKEDTAFRLLNENLIKLSCKNRAELYNGKMKILLLINHIKIQHNFFDQL